MTDRVSFFAPGIPRPGGSKRAFVLPNRRTAVIVDAARGNKDWRAAVALAASQVITQPFNGPIYLKITFYMPRPKAHYGRRGLLPRAPTYHQIKPDLTKLARSTEDALAGIAWRDDALVCHQKLEKVYSDELPGAMIVIAPMSEFGSID